MKSLQKKCNIIVDLDGTIANGEHRDDLAKAGSWEEFHGRCLDDTPYLDVVAVIKTLGARFNLIGLTGRNERFRIITLEWFQRYAVTLDELLMRPDNDYSKSPDMKIRMLEERFGSKEEVLASVLCAFDDHEGVVATMRDYGITVFQPRNGTYG